ncbi:geranylgeranylglycerol-phosphate geranylgeranyltransferase [Candidatus Poribacteria bacterium]|nr:geranylgeranylglycerol-phosphate geranylgeranyltransferase [Candidatus Poribacteria bacterium]
MGATKTILAYLELSRPINGVIALISVLLGGFFAVGTLNHLDVLTVAISALLLLSAGNAFNDYCDYEIDRINKPQRPIPSGRVQRRGALIFAIVLLSIGAALGFLVNRYAALIALIVSSCLIAYAVWLKRTPLVGNLVVGMLTGLTFIAGGVAVMSIRGVLVPAIFAFLFTTAREIVKDIEDTEGDIENRAKTIAVISKRVAVLMALVFMFAVILFSPIPYLLDWYSWRYLLTVVIGVDLVLIYLTVQLWRDASKENSAKIQQWMKWDIFVGLGAIYLGSL